MQQADYNALVQAAIGRAVVSTDKVTNAPINYLVSRLDEKIGTMKSGDKNAYMVLHRADNTSVVVSLHPNIASKLLKNGTESSFSMVADGAEAPAEVIESKGPETSTTEPEVKTPEVLTGSTDIVTDTAGEGNGATTEEAAPEVVLSKKDRTIAIYKQGQIDKLVRKDIIAKLKSEVGLSAPGANTYYQNCKSGAWA